MNTPVKTIGDMSIDDAKVSHEKDLDKMQSMGIITVHGGAFARQVLDLVVSTARQNGLSAADMAVISKGLAEITILVQGALDAHSTQPRSGTAASVAYVRTMLELLMMLTGRKDGTDIADGLATQEDGVVPPNFMN